MRPNPESGAGRIRILPSLAAFAQEHATDAIAVAGVCCVAGGVGAIYRPAGWIALGVFLLFAAWRLE